MDLYLLITLIVSCLSFVYGIFMIMYLTDAKRCDKYMNDRDKNFRKVALVISWIDVVLTGLSILGVIIFLAVYGSKKLKESYMLYG
jgi:ABC-type antimicrobial peptide transport system permease subunit